MTAYGFYKYTNKDGEHKTIRNAKFESTGVQIPDMQNHVIWRKFDKLGRKTNIFAVQFIPEVPWMVKGKVFVKISAAEVITKHPELKVETEASKTMSDEEYIQYLRESFRG